MSYEMWLDYPHGHRVLWLLYDYGRLVERCWLAPQLSQPTSQQPALQPQPPPSSSCSSQAVPAANYQGTPTATVASVQCLQSPQQANNTTGVELDSYDLINTGLKHVALKYELEAASGGTSVYNLMDFSPALFGIALSLQVWCLVKQKHVC